MTTELYDRTLDKFKQLNCNLKRKKFVANPLMKLEGFCYVLTALQLSILGRNEIVTLLSITFQFSVITHFQNLINSLYQNMLP